MNIFVTHPSPKKSAIVLPDKHIVKMPLETCQMLAIVASTEWGHGFGSLYKGDGVPYKTQKGAFRNHPCTVWANSSPSNWSWLLEHGLHLCHEYTHRYNKVHSCFKTLVEAKKIFPVESIENVTPFARAMPEEFKYDQSIDTFTAYKKYISSKPWASKNYLRDETRKPEWM